MGERPSLQRLQCGEWSRAIVYKSKSLGNCRAFLNPLAHFRGEFRLGQGRL